MRAAILYSPGDVRFEDRDMPTIKTGVKLADLQPGDFGFFYACLPVNSRNCFRKRRMYVEVTT